MIGRDLKLAEARNKFGRPFAHEPGATFHYVQSYEHTGIDWKKYRSRVQLAAVPEPLKAVK